VPSGLARTLELGVHASAASLPWRFSPREAIRRWPVDRPLAALLSAGQGRRSRWSYLAPADGEALASLDAFDHSVRPEPGRGGDERPDAPPFRAGWVGWLGYDLGRDIEPAAQAPTGRSAGDDRGWAPLRLVRVRGVYAHDAHTGRWWRTGAPDDLPDLERGSLDIETRDDPGFAIDGLKPTPGAREAYERGVRRVLELIRAGDVYQVNLAHRLSGLFEGSARALLLEATRRMRPWYAALIEDGAPGRSVLSLSPELFLSHDPRSRRVTTRPIKGTRPASAPPDDLLASAKDQAELAMIVDLMRNDLGRVCAPGSIRVSEPRTLERHGGGRGEGVRHATATIEGALAEGRSAIDLVRAAFPPGSVTGAPKIRAMQIIDELESPRRGPYCGGVGWISDEGGCCLNVAIRTAAIRGERAGRFDRVRGPIDYWVGAGVVADSEPEAEWRETMTKAAGFLASVRPAGGAVASEACDAAARGRSA